VNVPRRALLRHFLSRVPFEGAPERIPVDVAGVRVDLLTGEASFAARAREYFRAYPGRGPAVFEARLDPLVRTRALWEDEDPEFHPAGSFVIQRDFCARHESDARAVALLNPEGDDGLHNFLRWLLPPLLLRKGAFLLHGTGIVRDGKGYVFFGPSGAGKSTTAALVREADPRATVVGDDAVIVSLEGARPRLHAAPLGCGYSTDAPPNLSAPLAGLFALEQGEAHAVQPLEAAGGVASLLASAMCVRYGDDAEGRIGLAAGFAGAGTGIRRLVFRKDAGFWPLVAGGAKRPPARRPSKEADHEHRPSIAP
jgi:hypothetical protein